MQLQPKLSHSSEQPYVAIRTTVKMSDIPNVLPPLIGEVFQWMEENKVEPAGVCFFRYMFFDDADKLVVDVGVPTAGWVQGNGRVIAASFPEGDYVTVTYTGDYKNLKDVHMELETWMKENNLKEGAQQVDGKAYGARTEFYITDPAEVADPQEWITDVSILLANN